MPKVPYEVINAAMYEMQVARAKLIKLHLQNDPDVTKLAHYLTVTPTTMKRIIEHTIAGTFPAPREGASDPISEWGSFLYARMAYIKSAIKAGVEPERIMDAVSVGYNQGRMLIANAARELSEEN